MAYDVDPIELLDSVVEYSAFKFPQSAHRFGSVFSPLDLLSSMELHSLCGIGVKSLCSYHSDDSTPLCLTVVNFWFTNGFHV